MIHVKKIIVLISASLVSLSFLEIVSLSYLESWALLKFKQTQVQLPINFPSRMWSGESDRSWAGDIGFLPHPFWAYTVRWSKIQDENDVDVLPGAFERESLLRHEKSKDEILIGVLGASVADSVAQFEHRTGRLKNHLRHSFPNLRSKKIRLINLAIPGFKQPQQINVLTMYAHKLDLLIGIDGINDIQIKTNRYFPFYFPMNSLSALFFAKSELPISYFKLLLLSRVSRNLSHEKLLIFSLTRTAALLLLITTKQMILDEELKIVNHLEDSKSFFYSDNGQEQVEEKAAFYLRIVGYQESLLKHINIPHFFFLQPGIFLSGTKKLSQEEEIFMSLENFQTYRSQEVKKGFRFILDQIQKKETGLIDLTQVFQDEQKTVYTDGCCHLNERGHEILIDKIAEHIANNPMKIAQMLKN